VRKTIKKLLTKENIFLDLKAVTKTEVIEEIIDRLVAVGRIKNKEAAIKAVFERENKMSTGMEHGIAIPHGKTDAVDQLAVAIARKISGIDFDSMDKKPSTIFVMTVSPESQSGPHLQFLAEVSKLLKEAESRKQILEAKSPQDVIKIFY